MHLFKVYVCLCPAGRGFCGEALKAVPNKSQASPAGRGHGPRIHSAAVEDFSFPIIIFYYLSKIES
jgi:hypothetical protein